MGKTAGLPKSLKETGPVKSFDVWPLINMIKKSALFRCFAQLVHLDLVVRNLSNKVKNI